MPTRREYSGNAPATTLSGPITNASTSFTVTDGTGYPTGAVGPFFLVIDPRTASEEKVLVTTRTGTTMSGAARGQDGTSAVAHSAGAVVEHVWTAVDAGEANRHPADVTLDDHTQYHNAARHGSVAHTTAMIGDAAVTAAKLAAAIPLGTLGYAEITASPATFTTEVAVAGLSVNVTVAANRRIKITFMARVSNNTAGAGVWAHIKEGADYRGSGPMVPGGTNQPSILTFSRVLVAPAAGAHTYSISVQTANGGTGTLTAGTDTAFTIPAFILVEDIGAA